MVALKINKGLNYIAICHSSMAYLNEEN